MLPKLYPAMLLAVSTAPESVDAMCASDMAKATARHQPSGSDGPTTIKHQWPPYSACITPGPCLGMPIPFKRLESLHYAASVPSKGHITRYRLLPSPLPQDSAPGLA
jgi:hypothetical protein